MPFASITCPDCYSEKVVKNGKTHSGSQNYKCKSCGRQFVRDPQNKKIDTSIKHLVDRLLQENLSLSAVSRVAKVSEPWLRKYISGRKD